MPVTRRSRTVAAPPEEVWAVVGDPHHLTRWWPRVTRVEAVDERAFTEVLGTDKGKSVRADFRVLESEQPVLRRWTQEVSNSPFERILQSAETVVRLVEEGPQSTRVTLTLDQRLRGLSRFGGWMVRGAAKRQLDEALANLDGLLGG